MKNLIVCAAVVSILLGSGSCGPKYAKPTEGSDTGFALSFFVNVSDAVGKDENLVVSPYSAGVAMSMLAEGAEGQTREQFDKALNGCIFKAEDLSGGEDVTADSVNSLWIDDDFSPRNRYVDLLSKDFNALVKTLDFADPATVRAINNWCSEHTDGKIGNVIDRLSPGMVMVLANALYFNAPWEKAFDAKATSDAVFHGTSRENTVKMMQKKATFNYAEYEGAQVVQLPYAGGRYSMYVILPPKGKEIKDLLPYASEDMFDKVIGMLAPAEVLLKMPKARLESSVLLNATLQNMGVKDAFTSRADFGGIAEMGPLVLDQVKQKCYVEIGEKGTEAAAVTTAQIRLTSARPALNPVAVMNVDRPYMFFIGDAQTGNILFAGKVVNL